MQGTLVMETAKHGLDSYWLLRLPHAVNLSAQERCNSATSISAMAFQSEHMLRMSFLLLYTKVVASATHTNAPA